MLVIRGLAKRYGAVAAVSDVSLDVGAGEIVALVGPNGAGKSTVLKAIAGLVRPSGGRIEVLGRPAREHPVATRRTVGFVPQRVVFADGAPAARVLQYYGRLNGADIDPLQALATVGLSHAAGRPARELSGGMMQRLALAVALLGSPPLLVLDEPMVSLDPDGSEIVRDLLGRHRERGGAALIATHLLSDAELLADRVVMLAHGRVLADGTVPALAQRFAPELRTRAARWSPEPSLLEIAYRRAVRAVAADS